MNDMTISGNVPSALAKFAGSAGSELGGGIISSFAVVTYKGKEWKIKYRGEYRLVTRDDVYGDGSTDPSASIEVVLVKAPAHVSKVFYAKGFTEGDSGPPDCWSVNAIAPDAGAAHKQSKTCAGCPQNVFGTAQTRDGVGGKGKACADIKRVAVVPTKDIDNLAFGGPMLLRVPPDSLKEIKDYGAKLDQRGIPYNAVSTRVSFQQGVAHPKLVFSAVRMLDNDEANSVAELLDSEIVGRILEEAVETARGDDGPAMGDDAMDKLGPVPEALGRSRRSSPRPKRRRPRTAKPAPLKRETKKRAEGRAEESFEARRRGRAVVATDRRSRPDGQARGAWTGAAKAEAAKEAAAKPQPGKAPDSFEGMLDEILPKK